MSGDPRDSLCQASFTWSGAMPAMHAMLPHLTVRQSADTEGKAMMRMSISGTVAWVLALWGVLLCVSGFVLMQSRHAGYYAGMLVGLGATLPIIALKLWLSPSWRDVSTEPRIRRYRRDSIPPVVAYVVVMLGWRELLGLVAQTWWQVLVALLPALLIALVIRAMARHVLRADEMQQRVELMAVGVAAAMVAVGYSLVAFLDMAELITVSSAPALLMVFPALCLGYGFSRVVLQRRLA